MESFRQELLDSIHPTMKLDKAFFLKIYSDSIYRPSFADEAIKTLEEAGCKKAREYYNMVVSEYQNRRDEELRPIARISSERIDKEYDQMVKEYERKGGEERRKQEEQNLQQMSNDSLMTLCKSLIGES